MAYCARLNLSNYAETQLRYLQLHLNVIESLKKIGSNVYNSMQQKNIHLFLMAFLRHLCLWPSNQQFPFDLVRIHWFLNLSLQRQAASALMLLSLVIINYTQK